MASVAAVLLLAAAIAGLVWLPRAGFAAPFALGALAVASGLVSPVGAADALRPLLAPLAFVLCAVPLAVLLDELGFFEEVARLVGGSRHYLGACWVLAGAVTALLNLDAAVVMLTPLYVRVAERRRVPAIVLCLQPLLLSCLASSALPISNLTNLIATPVAGLSTLGFLEHLAPPTLAASTVGWWCYLRLLRRDEFAGRPEGPGASRARLRAAPSAEIAADTRAPDRRLLALGGAFVMACVAGFIAAPSIGAAPYEVAAGGDVVLVALTRRLPWRAVPGRSVVTVLGLGVLADALATHVPIDSLLGGSSPAGMLRDVGVLAVGGSALNNLPALLVTLHRLAAHGSWSLWAALAGDNIAPLALPTGTLAALLWLETVHRLGVRFRERDYLRVAWRVALPSLVAAVAVLLGLRAAFGPGQ